MAEAHGGVGGQGMWLNIIILKSKVNHVGKITIYGMPCVTSQACNVNTVLLYGIINRSRFTEEERTTHI